jgi:hypothetical protein
MAQRPASSFRERKYSSRRRRRRFLNDSLTKILVRCQCRLFFGQPQSWARTSNCDEMTTSEIVCFVTLGRELRAPSQLLLAHIGMSLLPTPNRAVSANANRQSRATNGSERPQAKELAAFGEMMI